MKTDGLAEGKGVLVTESLADAHDAVRAYLSGEAFGDAGRTLVIEEGLTGPELSLLVVCNGDPDDARPLAPAQDFKRIGDGDTGPNTGGMGAYSPVPVAPQRRRRPRDGSGVMPDAAPARGAWHRLPRRALRGDDAHRPTVPRSSSTTCGSVTPRRRRDPDGSSGDFAELLHRAAAGEGPLDTEFTDDACVTRRARERGLPGVPATGDVIAGLDADARASRHGVPRGHQARG